MIRSCREFYFAQIDDAIGTVNKHIDFRSRFTVQTAPRVMLSINRRQSQRRLNLLHVSQT